MLHFDSSSLIFPKIRPLPEVLGAPRARREILDEILSSSESDVLFHSLSPHAQQAFLEFCEGSRGLKVTFDPFFRFIFNPDAHPERLNRLLSCILGQKVSVERRLPRDRPRFSEKGSLIIMDILVRLENGSLINVEMQRIGYEFPGERGSCHSADLLMRQYDLTHETRGKDFSYRDMKPVYTIILLEKSTSVFHEHPGKYVHRSALTFDTGLKMSNLQNFIYIPLDIFRKLEHNELTELDAWLYFLSSDRPADILRTLEKYPFFRNLYQDIVRFRYHPKELITMFSDALRIMDENTVQYMVDELKAQLRQKDRELQNQAAEFQKQRDEISRLRTQLARYRLRESE